MSHKAVFCIANSRAQAERIVAKLKIANFSNNDISVLFPDTDTTRDFAHEIHTKAPEGALAGASAGGVVGGLIGWGASIGALVIPGIGPFLAAGPILLVLSGAAVGGMVGGLAGGLVGLGIPEFEAKRFEGKLMEGNVLLSVHTQNSEEQAIVEDVFIEGGGTDICSSRETPSPTGGIASERAPYVEDVAVAIPVSSHQGS